MIPHQLFKKEYTGFKKYLIHLIELLTKVGGG